MSERICLECVHMKTDTSGGWESDPSIDHDWWCAKSHWGIPSFNSVDVDDKSEMAAWLVRARTCVDFEAEVEKESES